MGSPWNAGEGSWTGGSANASEASSPNAGEASSPNDGEASSANAGEASSANAGEASSANAGEANSANAGEASSASAGGSAAEPQPSTSSQRESVTATYFQGRRRSWIQTERGICDIFVSAYDTRPAALSDPPVGLPSGKYKLVACELATTGRRLIDEICIIAAYARPEQSYIQYIMPHGELYPGARRRHQIRVCMGRKYRVMRSTISNKIIRTKLELGAVQEFMEWLKSLLGDQEKILLLYHEPRRLTPIKLIQAVLRYNLMEKFMSIVAGFSDSYALCFDKCGTSFKSVSIDYLAKVLLDDGLQDTETAMQRATATYNVLEQLASQGSELQDEVVGGEGYEANSIQSEMIELACTFGRPVHTEIEAFKNLKELVARQDTFRLVLAPLLNCSKAERRRLTLLRRVLAEAGLLFEQVKDAWHEGRRAGIVNLLSPLENVIKPEEIERIVSIFVSYFKPSEDETAGNSEAEEQDELYFSDMEDSDEDRDSDLPDSSDELGGFATAEDYLNY